MATITEYPFTEEDSRRAYDKWGANCGPNALAFALGLHIDDVRHVIPGFEERRYTSPSMMKMALGKLGRSYFNAVAEKENMCRPEIALVRIQWCGPWTAPGANGKWAYRHTHWIASWQQDGVPSGMMGDFIFDVNGGVQPFPSWMFKTLPMLIADIERADGHWYPTDIWRLDGRK